MNGFAVRTTKEAGRYRGEYRLAHWAGFRTVLNSNEETMLFAHPSDAYVAATTELLDMLNSQPSFWIGHGKNDAKAAAEKLFKGKADGCMVCDPNETGNAIAAPGLVEADRG